MKTPCPHCGATIQQTRADGRCGACGKPLPKELRGSPKPDSVRIGKYEWAIKQASVTACVLSLEEAKRSWGPATDGLAWTFDIATQPIRIESELVDPHISYQVFLAPAGTWRALEGMPFWCVPRSSPDELEGPLICIHEHDEIQNAAFTFGKREGTRFRFHFTGEYLWFEMKPDPITVDTWMDFTGVVTYASSVEEARTLVAQHLDSRHLRTESEPPIDMTQGTFQFRFRPIEDL